MPTCSIISYHHLPCEWPDQVSKLVFRTCHRHCESAQPESNYNAHGWPQTDHYNSDLCSVHELGRTCTPTLNPA